MKDGETNLLSYWSVIFKFRKSIVLIVAFSSIIAFVVSLVLPKTFRAQAVITPISSKGGALSAFSSQLSGLASLVGLGGVSGSDDTSKLVVILNSRTLAENVIHREQLMPILFPDVYDQESGTWKAEEEERQPNIEEGVRVLTKDHMVFSEDKIGQTITVMGEFSDPMIAANVVNTYLKELQEFMSANTFSVAKKNRIFIEGQLEQNKRELLESGKEINEFYNTNKVSNVDAKVNVPINGFETPDLGLEARDSDKTLYAANESDEISNGSAINSLMSSKAELDKKIANAKVVNNVPQQVYLTYLMMRRELLGKVNALLTTQYEMAKIEEAKEEPSFQTIDYAVPPIKKFKPNRKMICVVTLMCAVMFSLFQAFVREHVAKLRSFR